jgi:hypothetical protein
MWIIGQKIFSDKNILPIKTANIFGKQYFTNKHVLAGQLWTNNRTLRNSIDDIDWMRENPVNDDRLGPAREIGGEPRQSSST